MFRLKVLLVDPLIESASSCPSLALMYIASVLEKSGVEVSIEEMRFMHDPWHDIENIIAREKPDIVGISSFSYTYPDAIRIATIAKEVNPETLTVLGGPHVSFTWKETIERNPQIDVIVIGEGEDTILNVTEALGHGSDLEKVRGIALRKNSRAVTTPRRGLIENLDLLPFPARHLASMDKYLDESKSTTMITSRGCPYKCVFCASRALWGSEVRMRTPENVAQELRHIVNNYDIETIGFVDDVFTLDKKRTLRIAKHIQKLRSGIEWECSTRIDLLSKELLKNMKSTGCRAIFLGIESGSQNVLNRLRKGTVILDAEKVIGWAKEIGIETRLSFVLGCPGDTKETSLETLRFARKLKRIGCGTVSLSLLKVYPGTPLFENPDEFNLTFIDKDWGRRHGAPLIPTCSTRELSLRERYLIALSASTVCVND